MHAQKEQFGNICVHTHSKEVQMQWVWPQKMREGERRELYLAAVLSADGLLLLTMLIKLHSSTNKAKGLNMGMSDEERMARIVRYDLYFYFDSLPGIHESCSSLREKLELEVVKWRFMKPRTRKPVWYLSITHNTNCVFYSPNIQCNPKLTLRQISLVISLLPEGLKKYSFHQPGVLKLVLQACRGKMSTTCLQGFDKVPNQYLTITSPGAFVSGSRRHVVPALLSCRLSLSQWGVETVLWNAYKFPEKL